MKKLFILYSVSVHICYFDFFPKIMYIYSTSTSIWLKNFHLEKHENENLTKTTTKYMYEFFEQTFMVEKYWQQIEFQEKRQKIEWRRKTMKRDTTEAKQNKKQMVKREMTIFFVPRLQTSNQSKIQCTNQTDACV